MTPHDAQRRGASLGSLFSEFTRELSTLVRQETQLMKAEISEKVSEAGTGMGSLAIGGAVLFGGFLILLLALVAMLQQMMGPTAADYPWLAPLIVGSIVLGIGAALLLKGRNDLKAKRLMPRKSGESLRRDTEVLREQFK
jgi:xanthine/uracil permease